MGLDVAAPTAGLDRLGVSADERLLVYQPTMARIAAGCGVAAPAKAPRYLLLIPNKGRLRTHRRVRLVPFFRFDQYYMTDHKRRDRPEPWPPPPPPCAGR